MVVWFPNPVLDDRVDVDCMNERITDDMRNGVSDGVMDQGLVEVVDIFVAALGSAVGGVSMVLVAIETIGSMDTCLQTTGSGARNTNPSSSMVQHVVFALKALSCHGEGFPVLQHHFSDSGHFHTKVLPARGKQPVLC